MATKINVNGKFVTRPGVYATIKSGVNNPNPAQPYGSILIIDDGIGAGYGGGSGINGELQNKLNAIYEFTSLKDFRDFVKGGELWKLGEFLFNPADGAQGVSKVTFIRAATTEAATMTWTFTNGGFAIQTRDEGLNANGVIDSTSNLLKAGYGSKLIADGSKYYLEFYHGTFKGTDSNNSTPYDGLKSEDTKPLALLRSPSVATVAELVSWMESSNDFKSLFILKSGSTATGNIVVGDIPATNQGYVLAIGGTENYSSGDLTTAIENIDNLDFTFILACKYGSDASSVNNTSLFNYVKSGSKYERFLVIGGGYDASTFLTGAGSSGTISSYYNSDKVIVIHGGIKQKAIGGSGVFNVYSQFQHAGLYLGRLCGLEPQNPVTLKTLGIDGLVHMLSDKDQEDAIANGIGYSYYDYELKNFVVGLDINTLHNNEFLVNSDSTSYNVALKRVAAYLNKSIMVDGKIRFFGSNRPANRNTLSEAEVISWLISYLQSKTATSNEDNLIITFQDVEASIDQDNINVSYKFVGNTEISKMLVTGTLIYG